MGGRIGPRSQGGLRSRKRGVGEEYRIEFEARDVGAQEFQE